MPKFAANLSLLFTELPFLDRFAAAAEAGFEAVEILYPYDLATHVTCKAMADSNLDLILINAPPPHPTGGKPGYAAAPGQERRFQHDTLRALRYAEQLRPNLIHVMAGYESGPEAKATMVRNLQWAADLAPSQGFTIEPLNEADQPGYFLNDFELAADILDLVDRKNVRLQYDSYHAQVIHGDAAGTWEKHGARAAHIQIGAAPGRSEPGPGLIDFPALFAAIDASDYAGWVSAEYNPTTQNTADSLHWKTEI